MRRAPRWGADMLRSCPRRWQSRVQPHSVRTRTTWSLMHPAPGLNSEKAESLSAIARPSDFQITSAWRLQNGTKWGPYWRP